MADVVASESAPWRFVVRVFLAFATLAALLSAIGLGTVIALAVSTRRRELAIRAALGADRRRLRAVVMKEGTRLVGVGVLLGLGAFVSLLPGKDGLVHISKLRALAGGRRVENVDDVVSVGQKIQVEVAEIDGRGKLSLSPVVEEATTKPADEVDAAS